MDLDSFLTERNCAVDDWWQTAHPPGEPRRVGRWPRLSPFEVLTLAVLGQWSRWRGERDFGRFALAHLRGAFPRLGSHSQLNRRVRALAPELRALQAGLAAGPGAGDSYHVLDTTPLPAIRRVRACRQGLFVGQATFGYCRSETDWVYGFKVAPASDIPAPVEALATWVSMRLRP
jgi:hypothetical protein